MRVSLVGVLLLGVLAVAAAVWATSSVSAPAAVSEQRWVAKELPGPNADAASINDRGQVVGSVYSGQWRAALWVTGKLRRLALGKLPAGSYSTANAINNRGQIVGGSAPDGGEHHITLWQNGKMRDLGTLPGPDLESEAEAINNLGVIVGCASNGEGATRAWSWANGKMRDLGTLGRTDSCASSINDRGQIVGYLAYPPTVFLYEKGRMRDLRLDTDFAGALINNNGWIASTTGSAVWNAGHTKPLCPAGHCMIKGINDRGWFVGSYEQHAALWQNGRQIILPTPWADAWCSASDINNRNQIVGTCNNGGNVWEGAEDRAFVWTLAAR